MLLSNVYLNHLHNFLFLYLKWKNLVFFFTGEKEIDDRKFTSVINVLLSGYCFDIFLKYNSFINSKNCHNFPLINPD
jgi:hypothetical protein